MSSSPGRSDKVDPWLSFGREPSALKGESAVSINRKERIQMVLRRERPDRLPTNIIYTPQMGRVLASHYGVPLEELPGYLDQHLMVVLPDNESKRDCERGIRYDAWGVGWSMNSEGFQVVVHPIEKPEDFRTYTPPDPMDPNLLLSGRELIRKNGKNMFICGGHGFVLFEGASCLLGFENFMLYLMTERDFITKLLDCLTDYHVKLAHRMVDLGVDGGFTGDDWGCQRGLMISPELWRQLFKPRIARIWEVYKKAGLPVMHHSCGDVTPILDDLVEIGLDLLNPVQPRAMDQEYVMNRYGRKLSFCGGVCNQTVLPFGTPAEVVIEVKRAIDLLGRYGGYIIGPSHELTTDIPVQNVDAMISAIRENEPWD